MHQFWDSECVASRYFAIHAKNLDPRFLDAKKPILHSSGAYFSITQATASYDAFGTCNIVLFADTFISESMVQDVLVDAGAIVFSVETPPKDSPRRWINEKLISIWDAVANSKLRYYCTGNQPDAVHPSARQAAERFVINSSSRLQTLDKTFSSKISCVTTDGNLTSDPRENFVGYPPEYQANAYHLWMQDIWDIECPIDVF